MEVRAADEPEARGCRASVCVLTVHHGDMSGLLEVVVLTADDARRAEEGGADRLMMVGELTGQGRCPEPSAFRCVRDACTIPIRPLLRLRDGYRSDGGEVTRLRGLASNYLSDGAEGFVLGFLDGYSQVDTEIVAALTDAPPKTLPGKHLKLAVEDLSRLFIG